MNILKKITRLFTYLAIILITIYIILMILIPKNINNIINYKFYTVLSNSMEPTIPTYSLVCVKTFKKNEVIDIKPKQIITFNANRFGEKIVITHRFNKIELDNHGTTIYRTNAEGAENLDIYETTRNDLIGTYIFHIPYIGKIFLFLKSKFGFILYGELTIIFLINSLIKTIWQEKLKDS